MWKPKIINTDKTLYVAIAEAIELDIIHGVIQHGEKMPPQRKLAKIIGVNLTTISRAYAIGRKKGYLSAVVGQGTFAVRLVSHDTFLSEDENAENLIDLGMIGSLIVPDKGLDTIMEAVSSTFTSSKIMSLLDYAPSQGRLEDRKAGAIWIRCHGMHVNHEDLVITAGATHAINCVLNSLFEPGDRIAVDALTYAGFIEACKGRQIDLIPVSIDAVGMLPDQLDEVIKKFGVKGVYLMPNLQNPTATSMSLERKQAIADVLQKHGTLLIEDDIYGLVEGNELQPISTIIPKQSVYICGVSKSLYPGLRIAYSVVPKALRTKYIQCVTNTMWMAPPMMSAFCTELILSGVAYELVQNKRIHYKRRFKMARQVLGKELVSGVENSMFLWIELPEHIVVQAFVQAALERRVKILSASHFHVGHGKVSNAVRISLCNVQSDAAFRKGLEVIADLIQNPEYLVGRIM